MGCGDGDCSLFLASRGYQVVAADHSPSNYNNMRAVYSLRQITNSSFDIVDLDLDDRFVLPPRTYSLALMLGVLYHLKNPFFALEYLSRIAPCAFVSTRTIEVTPEGHSLAGIPVAYLVGELETNSDPTNFWMFSTCGLERLARRAGWDIVASMTAGTGRPGDPVRSDADSRTYLFLESRIFPRERIGRYLLGPGWYDAERDGWRWTARKFALTLIARKQTGLRLTLQLLIPESLACGRQHTTLKVKSGEQALESAVLTPGVPCTYVTPIPQTGIRAGRVEVQFELSTAVPPSPGDQRELGAIVSDIRVEERAL